jgi:hypothetical protein
VVQKADGSDNSWEALYDGESSLQNPTECREEYLDIVKAARGDGYAALHNILRLHHPRPTEQIVEVKYPSQNVSMQFGELVKLVQ